MNRFDPIEYVREDGLIIPDVGIWGLEKYKLQGAYCDIFTSGMRKKWEELVYIDLFAGAGFANIRDENRNVKSSSLIAASIPHKFTKYILCEQDEEKMNALKHRFNVNYPNLNADFICGDSNEMVDEIIDKIPKSNSALRFCFVDPFSLNLNFETIKKISQIGRVDFLILLALQMGGKRNFHNYIKDESSRIDEFIGNNEWRTPFRNGEISQDNLVKFLADSYDSNMSKLGYVVDPKLKYPVKNKSNLPLYYLAFYSKNPQGNNFYKSIERYQTVQMKLF